MGKILDVVQNRLAAGSPTEEQRKIRQRHLRLMAPLIALMEGRTELTIDGEVPTEAIRRMLAVIMRIDPAAPVFEMLQVVAVPMGEMERLPRKAEDYDVNLMDIVATFGAIVGSVVPADNLRDTFDDLAIVTIDTFGYILARHAEKTLRFEDAVWVKLVNGYILALAVAVCFAEREFDEGMRQIGPLLRVMALVLPMGFLITEGLKIHVICR